MSMLLWKLSRFPYRWHQTSFNSSQLFNNGFYNLQGYGGVDGGTALRMENQDAIGTATISMLAESKEVLLGNFQRFMFVFFSSKNRWKTIPFLFTDQSNRASLSSI